MLVQTTRRPLRGFGYDFTNPFVAASEAAAIETMYLTTAVKRYASVAAVLLAVGGGLWWFARGRKKQ